MEYKQHIQLCLHDVFLLTQNGHSESTVSDFLIKRLIENGWVPPIQRSPVAPHETAEEMIRDFKKGYSPL